MILVAVFCNYYSELAFICVEMRNFAPMNDFKEITSAQLLDIILQ